jgi:acetyl esterase/lipase
VKPLLLIALAACAAPRRELALWPTPATTHETTRRGEHLVAGKPWTEVHDVSRPTITIYPPHGENTGAAVVVLPGGGYKLLAIDLEGTEACDWLTSNGITCVLLKYRVPASGPHTDPDCHCQVYPPEPLALQDAQRALGLVRLHAPEWHVDPHKIGVLGFSAGGHLAAALSTRFETRVYTPVDDADRQSCRPDFAVLLYPGHLWVDGTLNPEIVVTARTPPTFLVHAEDDDTDDVHHSLVYDAALEQAGVPVEMHIYPHGGHAFGLRRTAEPITHWPELALRWLQALHVISG